ncbi:hypothetical protein LINPERPRIM_LOCUS24485 [Linum perenne]
MLILITAGPTNSQQERVYASVVNNLSKSAIVDDDIGGVRVLVPGSELKWDFVLVLFSGITLYWCDVAVDERRVHFDAYWDNMLFPPNFAIKDDGVSTYYNSRSILYPWTKI